MCTDRSWLILTCSDEYLWILFSPGVSWEGPEGSWGVLEGPDVFWWVLMDPGGSWLGPGRVLVGPDGVLSEY